MVTLRRPPPRRGWELEPVTGRRVADPQASVAVFVYRGVTTVEVETPAQRLADRLRADVVLVGERSGPIPGVEPSRLVVADAGVDDGIRPDVLVVPGGLGWRIAAEAPAVARWLTDAATAARAILAISTGSLLLATIGALAGRDATGHWLAEDDLARLGAHVSSARVARAEGGRLITASGALAAARAIDEVTAHVTWSPRDGEAGGIRLGEGFERPM